MVMVRTLLPVLTVCGTTIALYSPSSSSGMIPVRGAGSLNTVTTPVERSIVDLRVVFVTSTDFETEANS